MKMSLLRELLKNDQDCNPFSDKYNYLKMMEKIQSIISLDELNADPLGHAPFITQMMNESYKQFYSHLKQLVLDSRASYEYLIDLIITLLNKNYLHFHSQRLDLLKHQKSINVYTAFNLKTTSANKVQGEIEISSALELEIDALNRIINYIRYYDNVPRTSSNYSHQISSIASIENVLKRSILFTALKNEYENSVWNNGNWQISRSEMRFRIDLIFSEEQLILNKIGFLRLQQHALSNVLSFLTHLRTNEHLKQLYLAPAKHRKKNTRIRVVSFVDGFVQYSLEKGLTFSDIEPEIINLIELNTFYSFISDAELPTMQGLTLYDLIQLYTILQDLVLAVVNLRASDQAMAIETAFPARIQRQILLNYLGDRSRYSNSQLEIFVSLICNFSGNHKINLWDKPLFGYKDIIYFNFLPCLDPIFSNLVDHWLDEGGFLLNERGTQLEQHIIKAVFDALKKRNYKFRMPAVAKVYNKQKKYEEIDFLLNLNELVVVAEVKCIKYPMETRDKYNAVKRLTAAAKQVNKKVAFLQQYASELQDQIGQITNKVIFPIIVTNNPSYTGYSIDGVAVTDFLLFESYFESGQIRDIKYQINQDPEIINSKSFYSTEMELNKNLPAYFTSPPLVERLRSQFIIKDLNISSDNSLYDIYVTSAEYK